MYQANGGNALVGVPTERLIPPAESALSLSPSCNASSALDLED